MRHAKVILAGGVLLLAACSGGTSSSFNGTTSTTASRSGHAPTTVTGASSEKVGFVLSRCPTSDRFLTVPTGFELSTSTDITNGPLTSESFGELANRSSAAAKTMGYVQGCEAWFDSASGDEYFHVMLVEFRSPADASFFTAIAVAPATMQVLPKEAAPVLSPFTAIAGATAIDETKPESDGTFTHGVIAARGSHVMLVEYITPLSGKVPALETIAKAQYELLPSS